MSSTSAGKFCKEGIGCRVGLNAAGGIDFVCEQVTHFRMYFASVSVKFGKYKCVRNSAMVRDTPLCLLQTLLRMQKSTFRK